MSKKPMQDRRSSLVGLLVCSALAAAVVDVHAQPTVAITEAEFLTAFDDDHPLIVALTAEWTRARADRRRAAVLPNPSFSFEHEAPVDQADQTTLALEWRPPLDGRRGLAIDASEATLTAAAHDLDTARLAQRQQMRALFAAWAVAEQQRELVARHVEHLRELETRLNVRAARGEESELAARRFALAVSEVRAELGRAEAEALSLRGRARAAREGVPDGARPVLPVLPDVPEAPGVLENVGDPRHPDLLARRSEVEAARLRERLAGRVFEFPALLVGWTRLDSSDERFDGPVVGLSWQAPLFDRQQGDREESTRAFALAQARLHQTEREIAQRTGAALEAYATLHARHREVAHVVEQAPDVAEAASASFLAGESSMTDLLDALRSVLASQLASLDLRARALAAHRELESSTGRILTRGDSR